jgi:hypothetical protein
MLVIMFFYVYPTFHPTPYDCNLLLDIIAERNSIAVLGIEHMSIEDIDLI